MSHCKTKPQPLSPSYPSYMDIVHCDISVTDAIMICLLCFYVGFLELINNMLTSGMVPALYPDDEKEAIIGQVTPYLISRF